MSNTSAPVRETNVQFVTRVMEYAESGPMMQAFVIVALEKYAEAVAKMPASTFDNELMSGDVWVQCAKELQQELKSRGY